MKLCATEGEEQAALFEWAKWNAGRYPELDLIFHIPNGSYKSLPTARRFQREGLRAGVPDICLPVGRSGYHALFIELKRKSGGRVSEVQKEWIRKLEAAGNRAAVCHGWEEAAKTIAAYLGLSGESRRSRSADLSE